MRHITLSPTFEYGTEPFAAFRANLVYGRNKRDREFLPVKDVKPIVIHTVTADYGKIELYSGTDKVKADEAKTKYEAEHKSEWKYAELKSTPPTLPENKFRIIKTKEKGTILVVPGDDNTNRCLLFVGCNGGFRGGVSLVQSATTAQIIKECSAGNACESRTDVIALLEVGQQVVFHTSGRRTNEVYVYTWDGKDVKQTHYSKEEWDQRNAIAAQTPTDDAEVL